MAADALDILDELVECEVSILQPHIRLVVHFSLEVCPCQCFINLLLVLLSVRG